MKLMNQTMSTLQKGLRMSRYSKILAATVSALAFTSAALAAEDANFESRYPDFACDVDKGAFNGGNVSVESLKEMATKPDGQEQIDRIYSQLASGPIPSGFYNGTIVFAKSDATALMQKFVAALGLPALNSDFVKTIGEGLWKGKVFKPDPNAREGVQTAVLANKMPVTDVKKLFAALGYANPEQLVGSANITNEWRFPAKVYCGQSLLDSRRESIIIDYAHSETVKDADTNETSKIKYAKEIDKIADRNNFQIRDEIRMVKKGLYLGRAYLGKVFVLNFVLECKEGACTEQAETADACSVGTQRQIASNTACMPMSQFRN